MCPERLREPCENKKTLNVIISSKCDSSKITLTRLVDGSGWLEGRKHPVSDRIKLGFSSGT